MNNDMKFAVLIDGDNISPKYLKTILDEVADNGVATYKRVYSDWTAKGRDKWKKVILKLSVTPIQQYSYISGKNATDSAMIIDAMDILYTGNVDGFYLVTSDSDFTRLAARLREAGKYVVGVGESKTPMALRTACNAFKVLEVLSGEDIKPLPKNKKKDSAKAGTGNKTDTSKKSGTPENRDEDTVAFTPLGELEDSIYKIIDENSNKGKETFIGEIGSRLGNKYPDFDVRNYGCTKLTTFIDGSFKNFVLRKKNGSTIVTIKKEDISKDDIREQIVRILDSHGGSINNMAVINEELKAWNPRFSAKQLGYSKFASFMESFSDIVEIDPIQNSVKLL